MKLDGGSWHGSDHLGSPFSSSLSCQLCRLRHLHGWDRCAGRWFLGASSLWVLRSLNPSHFSVGRTPGPHVLPTLSRCPNPQKPGLTTCPLGTECFIRVPSFIRTAEKKKKEVGNRERGTRTRPQTPPPSRAQGICPIGPRKTSLDP